MVQKNLITGFSFCTLLISLYAQAFNPTKLLCVRQDHQDDQVFLSEIHFTNSDLPTQFDGEVVSYLLNGSEKKYVSGYNLYSANYHNHMISGLTGDPSTRSDGSFTLTRMDRKNNGIWKFVYSNSDDYKIDADFNCVYAESPSDLPSR